MLVCLRGLLPAVSCPGSGYGHGLDMYKAQWIAYIRIYIVDE